jgi:hypothetical protein
MACKYVKTGCNPEGSIELMSAKYFMVDDWGEKWLASMAVIEIGRRQPLR